MCTGSYVFQYRIFAHKGEYIAMPANPWEIVPGQSIGGLPYESVGTCGLA